MSEELVKIDSQVPAIVDSSEAFQVDFGSIDKITPFTLSVDQPMTETEGAQPGMLRIRETGQLRKTIKVVLIEKPRESRRYEIGKYPNSKLVCFSRDMKAPDKEAPSAQAMSCAGCKHSKWERYNANPIPENIPGCKITARVVMVDYDRTAPIQMYVRGKSRSEGLEEGLQQVIQQFMALKQSQGRVAWTDVAMTLTTVKQKGNPNYQLIVRDVHPLTPEEQKHLSAIIDLLGRQKVAFMAKVAAKAESEQHASDDETRSAEVTKAVNQSSTTSGPIEGEYVEPKTAVQPQGSVEEI